MTTTHIGVLKDQINKSQTESKQENPIINFSPLMQFSYFNTTN